VYRRRRTTAPLVSGNTPVDLVYRSNNSLESTETYLYITVDRTLLRSRLYSLVVQSTLLQCKLFEELPCSHLARGFCFVSYKHVYADRALQVHDDVTPLPF
jgi:hypothetical protein